MVIKAVVFDLGGVVVGSPLVGINRYERERGLPHHYINVAITARGKQSAFQRLERNEIDIYTFYKQFGKELSDADFMNEAYKKYCGLRNIPVPTNLPTSITVDGRELFGIMMRESANPDPKVLGAVRKLKQSGKFIVAALTNNIAPPTTTDPDSTSAPGGKPRTIEEELAHLGMEKGGSSQRMKDEFHEFFESAVIGMRKPDPKIFQYTLDKLRVKGEEVVFLDDIGINLKSAAQLGIQTIRVSPTSSLPALRELEKYTGIKLVEDDVAQREGARLAIAAAQQTRKKANL